MMLDEELADRSVFARRHGGCPQPRASAIRAATSGVLRNVLE